MCRTLQYSRMFLFTLLLLFAATSTSWIQSNRKTLQQIQATHVPLLISSGRWTDTNRCTASYSSTRRSSKSDNSVVDDPLQEVQLEIRAVKYCLDNFGNITLPYDADKAFIQLIQRYDCDDKVWLQGLLKDLQGEETKLLPSNAAAVIKGMNDCQSDSINYAYYYLLCHAFQQMIPNYATNKKQRYVESGIGLI